MQFPNSFFDDEVREGFFVPSMMKRAWAAQLEILEDVVKVCEKHNIRWFADCGTLLGAVRHNGYIPWDDDLDICMLRDDYTRFNQVAKQELPGNYCVLNIHNEEDYWEMLTRVTNGRNISLGKERLEKYHGFPYAAGIDIFPLDYVAPREEDENIRRRVLSIVAGLSTNINDENQDTVEMQDLITQVEELCAVRFEKNKSLKKQLYFLQEKLYSLYSADEAKEVVLMPYWIDKGNHKYPLEFFENIIQLPFEGMYINAPASYEGVLKIEYGNYMKNIRSGGVHNYPFYKKQEGILLKKIGGKLPFKYTFSKDDLKKEKSFSGKKTQKQILSLLELINEAHEEICKRIKEYDYDVAMSLLTDCQNVAIEIGTRIEQLKGENFVTVGILENYCEKVYLLHKELAEGKDVFMYEVHKDLNEIYESIKDSVRTHIKEKKEIVFLVCKALYWDSFDTIWRATQEDEDCDVYVIPIPYYDRNTDGSFGEMHYEADKCPSYVPITNYNLYDFERRHPDIIFINTPYDECNQFMSVHPLFYASNLKRYTEKLVYIPYFVIDEITSTDLKGMQSTEHFVTVPGVVHADKVIVQSERMRDIYIDVMCNFAGGDTREVWEEKIMGLGSPLYDNVENKKRENMDIPESWRKKIQKEDGGYKVIVLYNISLGAFMEYGERMLEQIRSSFNIFKEYKDDVVLLWRPHNLIQTTCKTINPYLYEQYLCIVKQYQEEDWGIYDDSDNQERAIKLCDAYYGDSDSVAQQCKRVKKMVMIQDIF